MQLLFGLKIDEQPLPYTIGVQGGVGRFGPNSLLQELEMHLGLSGHPNNIEYLRIEQYRQAILRHLEQTEVTPFYAITFEADPFAVALDLLSRRDELLLAGWNFQLQEETPPRLQTLAEIEQCCINEQEETRLVAGFSDRFVAVLAALKTRKQPFTSLVLNEPFDLLPTHFQRLFKLIFKDIPRTNETLNKETNTDLAQFQNSLFANQNSKQKRTLQNDGSLLILKCKRANEAANYLAKLLKINPLYQPSLLVPEQNRTLDNALVLEGLPGLGIQSASLARPSLQILKLVSAFLWEPIDPYKILEFVSLSVKPLDDRLATEIANIMAASPGIRGDRWYAVIGRYFSELEDRAKTDSSINVKTSRDWYNFWFERQRYAIDQTVPKGEVVEIFKRLQEWAFAVYDDSTAKNNSMLVLSSQARRIRELLEELPETKLTNLELERIVRTIYEPSPVEFQICERGHLPYTVHPSAIIGEVKSLVWWNFIQNEPIHFFSRWYNLERNYLQNLGNQLDTPQDQNARLIWQRSRPIWHTQERLVLIVPDMVNGKVVHDHPLFGNLEATFENLEAITLNIDSDNTVENWATHFALPQSIQVPHRQLGKPKPFLYIDNLDRISNRDYETYSSLDALLYYPYKWMFQYKIKLRRSSILSVVSDNTLMGNLAHRLFEKMLKEPIQDWKKPDIATYIDREMMPLFQREGAVLLMYGREPERVSFVNRLKVAAWSLVRHLQQNNWEVEATEMNLEGNFSSANIKGITDLVLKRGDEYALVDLKWRGRKYRETIIRNEEDLQLVLYSDLISQGDKSAHTSYFIMQDAKMVARNQLAFSEAEAVVPDSDHAAIHARILQKMEATYQWRKEQVNDGKIEIRCKLTLNDLEDIYADNGDETRLMELLEMREEDAKFDDYKTLINLVD